VDHGLKAVLGLQNPLRNRPTLISADAAIPRALPTQNDAGESESEARFAISFLPDPLWPETVFFWRLLTLFATCSPSRPPNASFGRSRQVEKGVAHDFHYWPEAIRCDTGASAWREEKCVCPNHPHLRPTAPSASRPALINPRRRQQKKA
jgi:hypothetical protein